MQLRCDPDLVVATLNAEIIGIEALERDPMPDVGKLDIGAAQEQFHGVQSMIADDALGSGEGCDGRWGKG